jgi:RimJ/RimL family protein N-acetyltransferase
VPSVLDVQEPGAVEGLAKVFPQDSHPFPRDVIARRWEEELAMPDVECWVVQRGGEVAGFAATRGAELLHFGIAVGLWGTDVARTAHDAVVDHLRAQGFQRAWLRVFAQNARGRGFYEKLGWQDVGLRTRSAFPPYPELLRLELELGRAAGPPEGVGGPA